MRRCGKLWSALVLVVWLSGLALPLRAPHPVNAQVGWEAPPMPVASFGEHPRLLISRAYVENTLKPRAEAQTETWQAFLSYVDSTGPEEDADWSAGTALRALALAWLVTDDPSYATRARAIMVTLANRIENHPALAADEGFDNVLMEDVSALAIGYDWLYDALSHEDRAALRQTLWRAANVLFDPEKDWDSTVWLDGQIMAFGNYAQRWLWALTATGLALWGENESAPVLLDFCRETLTDVFIPALDIQTGGAWAEGPVYGFIANWPMVQTALAWWTAAGENYFDDTQWWYDRLAYDMFLYHPGEARTYNEDWGDPMHSYPSIIGDSERYHGAFVYGRAQDLLLQAVFAKTEHASWMAWFLRQPPDEMPAWMITEEFLWRDPKAAAIPPFQLTWVAPYLGHVFMRSAWTDESGGLDTHATYVSFNAGDHLAYHQFFDQGNFTIYHNGEELLVRSGVYSGDGTSDHDANWYVRSIAANTILICDLGETFDGIRPNNERDVWLNDCGQRSMSPQPRTAINADFLREHWRAYDTGSLVRVSDGGGITYLRADITGAYNSTVYTTPENRAKVSAVYRELVYWRPDTVFVFDRVVSTYPSYTPLVVFHFQTEPSPSGLFYGSLVGDSAIYMQNLLPDSHVTMVAGYQVAGQVVDQSWGEPVGNNFETDPYGYFRLEIAPARPDLEHWFLTAFVAQDADQPPPPAGVLIEGDTMRGVALGTAQAMFDTTPEDGADVETAVFQVAPGVETLLLTGLTPNADYQLTGEGELNATLSADDAGVIIVPKVQAGVFQLALAE